MKFILSITILLVGLFSPISVIKGLSLFVFQFAMFIALPIYLVGIFEEKMKLRLVYGNWIIMLAYTIFTFMLSLRKPLQEMVKKVNDIPTKVLYLIFAGMVMINLLFTSGIFAFFFILTVVLLAVVLFKMPLNEFLFQTFFYKINGTVKND